MAEIFIEAEAFKEKGGWVVDSASMESIHSAYLMAHGMGVPVDDAYTDFSIALDGEYSVWALTRDWTSVWDVADSAGKFGIALDNNRLDCILGTNGKSWGWQLAGRVYLSKGTHTISLHDLTGFNGRCDAIFLTTSDKKPCDSVSAIDEMRRLFCANEIKSIDKHFDLVVVGGGIAGLCVAISALRKGVSVALINDRPCVGGCNSSEVRVCMGGMIHLPPYPSIGNIVKEIAPVMGDPKIYKEEYFEDARKLLAFEVPNGASSDYTLFLNEFVSEVECENGRITSVVCTNTLSGEKKRISANMFADCSGDGIVARKTGCEVMYGRESADEFGESLAPKTPQRLVMGHSIRWYTEECDTISDFPDIDWNLKFTDESCLNCTSGDWEQETGFTRDMVSEIEYIRDYGLRAIYANWSYQKNHFKDKQRFERLKLKWVSPIGGKREGYRVKGDYIITQRDIEERIEHEDATACITWSIDMHFPEPTNAQVFGEAFRSFAYHRGVVEPYPIPYRCLYAKDVENLFIGGRLVSSSHVAFSSIRVMRTLGELGEVVGLASSVCKRHGCTPRQVYTEHLDELKELMKQGVPSPDAFACSCGHEEAYHFKDIGWWWLDQSHAEQPHQIEKFKRGVDYLKLSHKYPMPTEWK